MGTDKSCQERETDSYGIMRWLKLEDLVGSRNVFLVFSLWFGCFVLFQFVSFLFILLFLKCLFSSKEQKGVDLDGRESKEELEGVGEEQL